jgi:hypothetical protein
MTYYALNLTVDFNNAASAQVEDPGPNSRQWFTSPDGSTWTPFGNADTTPHPAFHFSRSAPANADKLMIGVFFRNLPAGKTISACTLLAIFTGQRRRRVDVSSPFRRADGSVIGILGLDGTATLNGPGNAYYTPFSQISLDASRLRPNFPNPLPFEFSVSARFYLNSATGPSLVEFNYDPEMEVSIDN